MTARRSTHRLKGPAYVKAALLLHNANPPKPDVEIRMTYMARLIEEMMGRLQELEKEKATGSVSVASQVAHSQ